MSTQPQTAGIRRAKDRFGARPGGRCRVVSLLLGAILGVSSATAVAAEVAPAPAIAPPPAGEYRLEKSHASLVLRANHMGFSTYTTRFSRFDAELSFDPKHLAVSKVSATIDTASFEMDAAPSVCLDIMKGPRFLDTATYPTIVFRSERVTMTGAKSMRISGDLTLRGVTRPIVLAASYNGGYAGMPEMDPHARIGFSAHGSFRRSDFGMTYGVPAPGSSMGVGDMVDFAIEAEFTGPALAAARQP